MKKILSISALAIAGVLLTACGSSSSDESWICDSQGLVASELSDRLVDKGFSRAEADMQAAVTVAGKC